VRPADFVLGLPAVAAAVAVAAVLAAAPDTKALTKTYQGESEARRKARDYPGALVCYKRLVGLEPDNPQDKFLLALTLEKLGRPGEAEALARSIAPADRAGAPLAHLWLAQRIIRDKPRLARHAAQAEGHLLRFLQSAPAGPGLAERKAEANAMLGGLYAATGRPREARARLEPVAGNEPDRLLDLARVLQALGDRDESLRRARAAIQAARARAEARPDDKVARLLWANACAFLQDYPGALEVLERGHTLTTDPVFRASQALVCSAWAEELAKEGAAREAERLAVIERGLNSDPNDPRLITQLGGLMGGHGPRADEARARVRGLLAAGKAPAMAHFVLGNDAWARGDVGQAREHWEQAYRLDPKLAIVANNLAWSLAYQEPADVPRALGLIEQAVRLNPGQLQFRGTRGEILVKAGRFKESLPDLEAALAAGAGTPKVHTALAVVYDNLGMAEMAAQHRKLGGQ
jgi:tetratricopeptide (TPR) repeat protein